jgi:hypothetical protein
MDLQGGGATSDRWLLLQVESDPKLLALFYFSSLPSLKDALILQDSHTSKQLTFGCFSLSMTRISVAYISASTNRHNRAAAVSSESLIAFGSSKLIALWDSAVRQLSWPDTLILK